MIDTANSNPLLANQIKKASVTIELTRVKVFISFLAGGLLIMSINFFLVSGGSSFFNESYTKYTVIGWIVSFLVFECISFLILNNYFRKKLDVPTYVKTINITLEALFPGFLLFLLVTLENSPIFLDSPLIFIYFILLSLSALNLQLIHTIILGVISTLSYLFVTIWAIEIYDPENTILYFPPSLYIARSFFMLFAFLGATIVAREFKKWLNLSLNWQHKNTKTERLFGQQVSGPIAQSLLENNDLVKSGEVSVLFLDIRGYSRFAEHKTPDEIIKFQNDFFNPIITTISQHNGIINQILGDGIMATFGAPLPDEQHAQKAFTAALAIFEEIERQIKNNSIPPTKIGIGIHSGKVVMGNIGNELRKQFSISGHTVNIAARIEQANKEFNSELLLSKSTYDQIEKVPNIQSVGNLKMKNISEEILVYKVF